MEQRDVDVCVVGAGFAGIAAARRVIAGGKTALLLEARERVGGRVWDRKLNDGSLVSVGGTWLGKNQNRMRELVKEVGLKTYPQYGEAKDPLHPSCDGTPESILYIDGKSHRYRGMFVPIGDDALVVLGLAFGDIDDIAATVDANTPWEGEGRKLDAQSLGGWIADVPIERARLMLQASLGLLFAVNLNNVSLLSGMLLAKGGGEDGINYFVDATITEQELIAEGGPPELARRLGEKLRKDHNALRTSTPVRRIVRTGDGVEVYGDDVVVRAKYVIVAAPPVLAGEIEYQPALPDAHSMLMEQYPAGVIVRGITVYDKPWWRDRCLSGFAVAPQSPVTVCLDQCPPPPDDSTPPGRGILSSYVIGKDALEFLAMGEDAARARWVKEITDRFVEDGYPPPPQPIEHQMTDWGSEEWSRGGMLGHFAPGVLTTYGAALHEPVGRIHWAGSERATLMHGLMEGAVLSGEKEADDVLRKLAQEGR